MAGIYPYMGATGERNDIGIVTEWQADYVMYEDAQARGYIRGAGGGRGSVPWHYRDENTWRRLSFATYPDVGWYGIPCWRIAPGGADIGPETGHSPDVSYVPFLVTGDPYMLEEMQFQATYDNAHARHEALGRARRAAVVCLDHAERGTLHSGDAGRRAAIWLQPKSYWEAYVAEALVWCLANGPNKAAGTYSSGSRIWRYR